MELRLSEKKKYLLNFLKKHTLSVISSVNSNGNPESAIIEFAETENLELIFDTFNTFRKYKNLQKNKHVSLVIGWDENITIQYEGIVKEIIGEELEKSKKTYFDKIPDAQKWENEAGIRYFKITPTWIRYSDLNKSPWYIFELKF